MLTGLIYIHPLVVNKDQVNCLKASLLLKALILGLFCFLYTKKIQDFSPENVFSEKKVGFFKQNCWKFEL